MDCKTGKIEQGLYAISDTTLAGRAGVVAQVAAALAGGVKMVQYRDKSSDPQRRHHEAAALLALCRAHQVPLLINDDIELAAAVGADGVHLGRDDPQLTYARTRLGSSAMIGISCYNQLALAQQAARQGADYVAFGAFFPSATKPHAVTAPLTLLTEARRQLHLPLVAIGGIRPDNGGLLIDAGADLLAVVGAIFDSDQITAACRRFAPLFPDLARPGAGEQ